MIDPRLVLEQREAVLRQLLRRFERIPAKISLSDELIAERRSAFGVPAGIEAKWPKIWNRWTPGLS